jgi:hypothetical protein
MAAQPFSLRDIRLDIQWLAGTPDRGDSTVDNRIRGVVALLLEASVSPGGWLEREGFFSATLKEGRPTLKQPPGGSKVLLTRVKTAAAILGKPEIWTKPDIEVHVRPRLVQPPPVPNSAAVSAVEWVEPIPIRLADQTLRMTLWLGAVIHDSCADYMSIVSQHWKGILQTLDHRFEQIQDPRLITAYRGLMRALWLKSAVGELAANVPQESIRRWLVHGKGAEVEAILGALREMLSVPVEQRSGDLLNSLFQGPDGLFDWAFAAEPKSRCPRMLEPIVCSTLLELLLQRACAHQLVGPTTKLLAHDWIERLKEGIEDSRLPLLEQFVARWAPHAWRALIFENPEDLGEIEDLMIVLFPHHVRALDDRLSAFLAQWQAGTLTLDLAGDLKKQLELLAWLGVRAEHAESSRHQALEILHLFFGDQEADKEETQAVWRQNWEVLAPLARLWPEALVLEGVSGSARRAHLRALVDAGHPQFAARLLDHAGLGTSFLQDDLRELLRFRFGSQSPAWRWWAFILARGPQQFAVDPSLGAPEWQLTTSLSHLVAAALAEGRWSAEIGAIAASMLNRGADPWAGGESAFGSPFEQTYLALLSRRAKQAHSGLRELAEQLEQILGARPWSPPCEPSGRRSTPRLSPLLQSKNSKTPTR